MTRYIELDSTRRNRNLWPIPGEFDVPVSNPNYTDRRIYSDPVCAGAPLLSWTSGYFNTKVLGDEGVECKSLSSKLGNANSARMVEVQQANGTLHTEYNFYKNTILRNMEDPGFYGRISEYIYLGKGRAQIYLKDPIEFHVGDEFMITDPSDFSDHHNLYIYVPGGSNNIRDYLHKIVYNETLQESYVIDSYDGRTGLLRIQQADRSNWLRTHNYSIRKIKPMTVFNAPVDATQNKIPLTAIPEPFNSKNILLHCFIRVPSKRYGSETSDNESETRQIVDVSKTHITVLNFPESLSNVQNIELLNFSYENIYELDFTKFRLDKTIFDVRLKRLILPNKLLNVGNGDKTIKQRYFYIELSNEIIEHSTHKIYSNNHHASKALFRASVVNISNPDDDHVLLMGDDMTQTIFFKFGVPLKFRVLLGSTGETFNTIQKDTMPPFEPNESLQINALFEFRVV
ncbi:169R [Cherax quadricarinatus iridovirus]|uniref:Uncharacterized protein n=1 Tax=Shrimp hemocyte iridescent virus TaxID=2039780 RepID=A0A291B0Z8_9VIRU|nr:169R [Cherax quadricarinatus iridovirus]YP_010084910.1 hypothetical protein KM509_gp158 [Shrimp hemocyte iridescent virus]UPA43313.1 hypothetical protein 4TH000039 [Iridovirus CN01]ASZ85149.1 169R [Cherax quadricarinatus iridovirus]ATE87167.1 hypothetical protein [Shrimp hemocyte iridescent virus]UPA43548.1 hypothetical protein 3TG000115 [Iridovirus CN01]UPA43745.1 hypothetical protein 1DG000153 [Iridovirus CN01]